MKAIPILAAVAIFVLSATNAPALVVEQQVTPQFIKEHPNLIAIRVERRDDGLVDFRVTFRPPQPRYLVAKLTLRKGSTLISENSFPSFTKGETTYFLAVLPEHLSDSSLEISARSFASYARQDVPFPGGTDYIIRLATFTPANLLQGRSTR